MRYPNMRLNELSSTYGGVNLVVIIIIIIITHIIVSCHRCGRPVGYYQSVKLVGGKSWWGG